MPAKKRKPKATNERVLTIDRRKWLRGTGDGRLLSSKTGRMCCLGFACLAFGIDKERIEDEPMPSDLSVEDWGKLPEWMRPINGDGFHSCMDADDIQALAVTNDNIEPDKIKEKAIAKDFAKHGIKVRFTH